MIKRLQRRAGLSEAVRPHDIGRHSFGARLAASGLSRGALKRAGNWKSDKAVARYEHFQRSQIDAAVAGVDTSKLGTKK